MRIGNMRSSSNVEDRRGRGPGGVVVAGGGLATLVIVVLYLLLGGNPQNLVQPGSGPSPSPRSASDPKVQFVSHILGDTEDVWNDLFRKLGREYQEPTLVLFEDSVDSACGSAGASVGPFYCPADSNIYIDLGFYDDLTERFGAPGDAAQAYVIAHEVGHHVQNLLGISDRVRALMQRASPEEANRLSVQLELQADFFAGVWAHHAEKSRNILEPGDVDEALRCAGAIGDDRIQQRSRGFAVPESFTHGSSAQRAKWLRRGIETGDLAKGDTFTEEH